MCPSCSACLEIDGSDAAPEEIRKAILALEGVLVEETGERKLLALSILRNMLGLSLDEIGRLRRSLPGPVMKGTRAEMEYLSFHLFSANPHTAIKRL